MSWVVEAFGPWYRTVYPHRSDEEAARLVRTLARHVDLDGRRILDVGCGGGRHLARLSEAGAEPVGVDLSPTLLEEAKRVRSETGAGLVRADMRRLPFGDDLFDGVTSLFTSFGYFSREEDREILLEAVRVLRPGGFHVLDFLNRDEVLAHPKPDSERTADGWRIRERRSIEDAGRRVVKRVVVLPADGGEPVAEYEERVNLYRPDELQELLAGAGLVVRDEWGEYDGTPFDPDASSRHVFLSRKERG